MAVAAPRRRADRDEHRVGFRDRHLQIGGKIEPPGLDVGGDQRIQPGLEDRDFPAAQGFDLYRILVHAGDLVAEIGKAGTAPVNVGCFGSGFRPKKEHRRPYGRCRHIEAVQPNSRRASSAFATTAASPGRRWRRRTSKEWLATPLTLLITSKTEPPRPYPQFAVRLFPPERKRARARRCTTARSLTWMM